MLRALVALVAAATLSACTTTSDPPPESPPATSSSPSPATPTTPVTQGPQAPERPRIGQCRRLSIKGAVAPTSGIAPVPCRSRHTAETIAVGRLELDRDGDDREVDAPAAQAQPRAKCPARLANHLGLTPRELRLTLARTVWFTPTLEEAATGADWFRCDLVVVTNGRKLARLPRRTQGLGGSDSIALCSTGRPGAPGAARVTCDQQHSWRAVATVDLPGKRLPGPEAASARMADQCRDAARTRAGEALDFEWAEERPSRPQWQAGQRYGLCWVPT